MLNVTPHQGNTKQYHLTPVRVAKMNKSGDYRHWRGCGERGTLLHCWLEYKLVQLLWKTVWRFLKKLKIDLLCDPEIALLRIYPRDTGVHHIFYTTEFAIICYSSNRKLKQSIEY